MLGEYCRSRPSQDASTQTERREKGHVLLKNHLKAAGRTTMTVKSRRFINASVHWLIILSSSSQCSVAKTKARQESNPPRGDSRFYREDTTDFVRFYSSTDGFYLLLFQVEESFFFCSPMAVVPKTGGAIAERAQQIPYNFEKLYFP